MLHLFRNLLSSSPLIKSDASTVLEAQQIHNELITVFEQECVLDILVLLGQEIAAEKNKHLNILVMENLFYLVQHQDPVVVARAQTLLQPAGRKPDSAASSAAAVITPPSAAFSLSAARSKEKLALKSASAAGGAPPASRHSRFGSSYEFQSKDPSQPSIRAANPFAASASSSANDPTRKKSKQTAAFVAGKSKLTQNAPLTPSSLKALKALNAFSKDFMQKCYLPLMKTLKDEFRRESDRLEEADTPKFFHLVCYFSVFQRTVLEDSRAIGAGSGTVGDLLATQDPFCWKMVTTKMEEVSQICHTHTHRWPRAYEEARTRGQRVLSVF